MIRQPAVAGSFYPDDPAKLQSEVLQLLRSDQKPQAVKAIIAPHAGYVFSGAVAGELIAATKIPEIILMFGPNHHGSGSSIAVTAADSWATPLGCVPIADSLRQQLCSNISELQIDERAHQLEHSLEVMLPLLLQAQPKLQVVPIALGSLSLTDCQRLATKVAAVLQGFPAEVLLLASSDMNHFLDSETTKRLDLLAIERMLAYDPDGLYQTVREQRISMCGLLPVVVVMHAVQQLGASKCRLLRHTDSGAVNGDIGRVVGYASLTIC